MSLLLTAIEHAASWFIYEIMERAPSKGEVLLESFTENQIKETVAKSNSFRAILRALGLPRTICNRMLLLKKIIVLGTSTQHFTKDGKNIDELRVHLFNLQQERNTGNSLNSKKARKSADFWTRSRFICEDAKRSDIKQNRIFDLDREYVANLIKNGCFYCGETSLKMTLDRKDNFIGHTKANCVPACIRCNLFRGDMPYDIWEQFVPKIRELTLAGLYKEWVPKSR